MRIQLNWFNEKLAARLADLAAGRLTPATPRDAATVMVLRSTEQPPQAPGQDLQVLMLRRTAAMKFAPGAYVFPGGSVDPADYGAEIGWRSLIVPKLTSSLSLFLLDSASEIVFSGDAGDTEASRPSRRYGVEFTNTYRPVSWLQFDGDLAITHARFKGDDPDQAAFYASLAGYPAAHDIEISAGNLEDAFLELTGSHHEDNQKEQVA